MSENELGGGLVGAEVSGGLASGVAQLGYDALIRHHNEKREDTRYQRLAKDLKASGLSKNIISGATASAQQAPTSDVSFLGDSFSKGIDRKIQLEELNIARAKANAELVNMEKTNKQLDVIIEGLQTDNLSKLEDLQHKRDVNAMNDLEVQKLQETIYKLQRDKDRLELEKERTKSYVDKQNMERDIKKIERNLMTLDYLFINRSGLPPIFWDKQGGNKFGLGAFTINSATQGFYDYSKSLEKQTEKQVKEDKLTNYLIQLQERQKKLFGDWK